MDSGAGARTVVDLILQDDEAERANLEKLLNVSQDGMVNYFIDAVAITGTPIWRGPGPGTAEQRLKAVRAFFQRLKSTETFS
jgi:hypothetical protein